MASKKTKKAPKVVPAKVPAIVLRLTPVGADLVYQALVAVTVGTGQGNIVKGEIMTQLERQAPKQEVAK